MTEKVAVLKLDAVDRLRESVHLNLPFYEGGDEDILPRFFGEENPMRTTGIEIPGLPEELPLPESKGKLHDTENSAAIFRAMETLKPQQAADERLWAHLTHYVFPRYARARWPIPADANSREKVSHVLRHWFVEGGNRGLVRDNAIARLWWMGFIASRCEGIALDDALAAALHRQDVRKNLFERSFCASAPIFTAMMKCLHSSYTGKRQLFDRDRFRTLSNALNRVGGRRLLDALHLRDLDALLADLIRDELGLKMSDL